MSQPPRVAAFNRSVKTLLCVLVSLSALACGAAPSTPTSASRDVTLGGLTLSKTSMFSGDNSDATVTLSGPAPGGGVTVTLAASDAGAVALPAFVTIQAGQTTGRFTVSALNVTALTTVAVSAAIGSQTRALVLVVEPVPPAQVVAAIELSPSTVVGGESVTVTVRLDAAGRRPTFVVMTQNSLEFRLPSPLVVPAGQSSVTLVATTAPVTRQVAVRVFAEAGGVSRSATLTITPPVPPVVTTLRSPTSAAGGSQGPGASR